MSGAASDGFKWAMDHLNELGRLAEVAAAGTCILATEGACAIAVAGVFAGRTTLLAGEAVRSGDWSKFTAEELRLVAETVAGAAPGATAGAWVDRVVTFRDARWLIRLELESPHLMLTNMIPLGPVDSVPETPSDPEGGDCSL